MIYEGKSKCFPVYKPLIYEGKTKCFPIYKPLKYEGKTQCFSIYKPLKYEGKTQCFPIYKPLIYEGKSKCLPVYKPLIYETRNVKGNIPGKQEGGSKSFISRQNLIEEQRNDLFKLALKPAEAEKVSVGYLIKDNMCHISMLKAYHEKLKPL